MPYVLLSVVIGLLLAWFVSEFQSRVWLRVALGIACFVAGVPIAFAAGGVLQRFNDNAAYGSATAGLVDMRSNSSKPAGPNHCFQNFAASVRNTSRATKVTRNNTKRRLKRSKAG
jgi:hypothetical protein